MLGPIFHSFSSNATCYTQRMTCPYCESPIPSDAPSCQACHLTFPKTGALFGAVPRIHHEVFDSTRQLTTTQQKSILKHIHRTQGKYPQLYIQVVLHSFPPPHPIRTQVFWLFNAAAFSGNTRRGSDNHTLLIAIDPGRMESAIMPGYGLEPLINESLLAELLDEAAPSWKRGDWSAGILCLLDKLDSHLKDLTEPDTSGRLTPEEF